MGIAFEAAFNLQHFSIRQMAELSVDEIAQRALALEILSPAQLEDVWNALGTQNVERNQFLTALLRQGHLTKYQVDRLAKGESTGFFYGEYKVLYSAGAGTFGADCLGTSTWSMESTGRSYTASSV